MSEPNYKRAFEQGDFRGYFKWTRKLTSRLGGSLYHACHKQGLTNILENGELGLRSKWSLKLPKYGEWSAPGAWVGLNYFQNGNYYGPFLLEFPLRVLNDRHFMVFRRTGSDRNRYFFIQYEAQIPVYSFGKNKWRTVNPSAYFQNTNGEELAMKPGAVYDIVITHPVALDRVSIDAVDHPWCISGNCNGMSLSRSRKRLANVAVDQCYFWLSASKDYRKLVKRFRVLDGEKIELFKPKNND
jgi:hypothetical protein